MDYQSLHMKTVVELRQLAKQQGVKVPAGTNKQTLIQMLLDSEQAAEKPERRPEKSPRQRPGSPPKRRRTPPGNRNSPPEKRRRPPESRSRP